MSQAPTPTYHLLVYRNGAPTPLAVAIEEVWSGDARPEEFAVTLEPGPHLSTWPYLLTQEATKSDPNVALGPCSSPLTGGRAA